MASSTCFYLQVNASLGRNPVSDGFHFLKASLSSTVKPYFKELHGLPMKVDVHQTIRRTSGKMLDKLVDTMFRFVDQPLLPSQMNFAPVEETIQPVEVICDEGEIPLEFPEGLYVRKKWSKSSFWRPENSTFNLWKIETHLGRRRRNAPCPAFQKEIERGLDVIVQQRNRYVVSETFKLETSLNKPCFLPAIEGDSLAILAAFILNRLRFGFVDKHLRNTSVFEHSGKLYAIAENYLPQEVDVSTLQSLEDWNLNGAWNRTFTSHPKTAPDSKELVFIGISTEKPYYEVGVVSADGKKLLHKTDLRTDRCVLSHEMGVTQKLVNYDEGGLARIGVMHRYGDADSVKWFEIEPSCIFHILNSFEDGDEVVVRGCRARASILPGPEWGKDKFEWFSRAFKFDKSTDGSSEDGCLIHHVHEWRLNMVTGEVKEKNLSGTAFSMGFPVINGGFTGLRHKYGYTQVIDSRASSSSGIAKYGGLAKLYLEEQQPIQPSGEENCDNHDSQIRVEYHIFPENVFCTGVAFVPKQGGGEEDDGWLITYTHNEETNVSQVYIIDAKNLQSRPTATVTLPKRVPYGFHGIFVSQSNQA